jgi:hypothetical protein
MKYLILLLFTIQFLACSKNNSKPDDAVARVNDKYLSFEDLHNVIPPNLSKEDSVVFVENYITRWIKKELIIKQAQLNLTEEDEIEQQVEEYRNTLYIYKYQQNFIIQRLDSIVNDAELKDYYKQYSKEFILDKNLVKSIFVKINKTTPNLLKVKNYLYSKKDENIIMLEELCKESNAEYSYDENWNYFESIISKTPLKIDDEKSFITTNKIVETQDSLYKYFLKITDYKLKGDTIPLDMIKSDIKNLVLNKRKLNLIKDMEKSIYESALNKGEFEIIKNKK